jgi:SAM-dependent methyltransferase
MFMSKTSEATARSVAGNVAQWSKVNREYGDASAARTWANDLISWGQFGVTEESIGSPLGDVADEDILELGCGTAYFSAWLARRGARPVGLDPTPAQLATARRLQSETGLEFPLIAGIGEDIPCPDASFDMVLSEYGASLWADPYLWIPEAARVLRPGGRLVFLTQSVLTYLCAPDVGEVADSLQRPMFGMHKINWPDEDGTEFNLAHGDWVRLLRKHGFELEDLIELQVPEGVDTHEYYAFIPADWGRQWPPEEIWVARLRG